MKKKHYIICAIIIALAVAFYFYFKKKGLPVLGSPKTNTIDKGFNIQMPDIRNDNFPLSYGKSKGTRVETLQRALNRLIEKQNATNALYTADKMEVLVPDGSFGAKTMASLLKVAGVTYYSGNGMTETQFNSLIELSNK